MSNYYAPQQPPQQQGYGPGGAQNLQFYQSSYPAAGTGAVPQQQAGSYGFGGGAGGPQPSFTSPGYGAGPGGVSGRMGEQGGLRTGWLAAFSSEGYDGEPPLLEELEVNFGHIQSKVVCFPLPLLSRCTSRC
jgi:protein YIPF5/7